MKLKEYFRKLAIYSIALIILIIMFSKIGVMNKIINYIKFDTVVFSFKDLLSITITILTVFVGAIITVATVLISMCDKRIIKLINQNNKSYYLVSCIKIAISTGLSIILLLAIVYSRLDFNIYPLRITILYLAGYFTIIFVQKSKLLIIVILSILNEAFKDPNHFIVQGTFKRPEKLDNK